MKKATIFSSVLLAASLLVGPTVSAAGDAAVERQLLMKHNGKATGTLARMVKGQAEFDAAVAKYIKDTTATITDMDSLKAAFGAAAANCGSCHKAYRVK